MVARRLSRQSSRIRHRPEGQCSSVAVAITVVALLVQIASVYVIVHQSSRSINDDPSEKRKLSRRLPEVPFGHVFERVDEIPTDLLNFDAILVLGGGVPNSLEEPPVYVQKRCDNAASVALNQKQTTQQLVPILCLSAGTAHLPQLMSPSDGRPIWESTSSAAYLHKQYGMIDNLFVETTSYDTIGNAYFARTGFTDVAGWRRLLVVTNKFHMDRSKAIFDWIFGIDESDNRNHQDLYELYYLASPDVGLTDEALKARQKHEAKGQKTIEQRLAPKYKSLRDVWSFLTHNHDLYTAAKLMEGKKWADTKFQRSNPLKDSYGGVGGKQK